ncbi:MAG: toxin-antitoxin system YwqK family antitoxin [Bacteroidales bacterium]
MKRIVVLLLAIITLSACSGEIKEITEKYPDGKPKVITFFKKKDDLKVKVREIGYYQSQKEMYKGSFENGIRSGKWTYWYETGKIFAETEAAVSISTQQWEILKPDQSPYMDKIYKISVTEIYSNGSPYHVIYTKPGEKMTTEIFFYPSYKIQMLGTSINNQREGKWSYWYENGNLWSEGYYKNAENDSIRSVWYENGNKRYEGLYRNGKEAGKWKFYEEKGQLAKEVDYDTVGKKQK